VRGHGEHCVHLPGTWRGLEMPGPSGRQGFQSIIHWWVGYGSDGSWWTLCTPTWDLTRFGDARSVW
jgi:hypothetical protein